MHGFSGGNISLRVIRQSTIHDKVSFSFRMKKRTELHSGQASQPERLGKLPVINRH